MNPSGGAFITLDGVDGGGKSTQIGHLIERLQQHGVDVVSLRDPGSTDAGEAIRGLLLDSQLTMHSRTEALLYMAARAELVEQRVRPALRRGAVVVCDRFLLANVVYQSAGAGEDPETLWRLGLIATGGLTPDLTILLDLPAAVALQRLQRPADRMESRGVEYLEAVRQGFLRHIDRAGDRSVVIDATQDVPAVSDQVWQAVAKLIAPTGASA